MNNFENYPPLPEPAHTQVVEYSGIAVNRIDVTPLFTTEQIREVQKQMARECLKLIEDMCEKSAWSDDYRDALCDASCAIEERFGLNE